MSTQKLTFINLINDAGCISSRENKICQDDYVNKIIYLDSSAFVNAECISNRDGQTCQDEYANKINLSQFATVADTIGISGHANQTC